MVADAFIICRVTSETKARVRALAARDGIGESTLIKQLLDVVPSHFIARRATGAGGAGAHW